METNKHINETIQSPQFSWRKRLSNFLFKSSLTSDNDEFENQFDDFSVIETPSPALGVDVDIMHLNGIATDGKTFLKLGINDGKLGIKPSAIREIAQSRASLWQVKIDRFYKQKFGKLSMKLKNCMGELNTIENDLKVTQTDFDHVKDHYRYNRRAYNRKLGIFYILISFILVFADLPLSIKVAKEAYKLNAYEQWIFASGLALMTVFFKIIYDEYVGKSARVFLLQKRPEIMLGTGLPQANSSEIQSFHKINRRQFWVKIGIVVLLVTAIIMVGIFRMESTSALSVMEDLMDPSKINPNTTPNPQTLPSASFIGQLSFICISVAFPVIGGISASVGFSHLNNATTLKKTNLNVDKVLAKKKGVDEAIAEIEAEMENVKTVLTWVNLTGNFLTEKTNYLEACYMHGFRRGIHENMTSDFYTSAENARNIAIVQKTADQFSS